MIRHRLHAAWPVLVTWALITAVFGLTWWGHPYFFLHDDNRIQYLPYFVHNARAAREGTVALYNWHQYMGTPHLANGNAAALYPLTVLGVWLSEGLLGHPFGAVDAVVWMHALIGSAGIHRLGRRLGWGVPAGLIAAVTWPLLSFFFYIGNSWFIATAAVAWLPWMVALALGLGTDPGVRTAVALALVRTLHFFAGHPQFFLYSVLAEGLVWLGLTLRRARSERRRSVGRYALSLGLTALWGLPLLLPLARQVRGSIRAGVLDVTAFAEGRTDLAMWVQGLLNPYEGHVYQAVSFFGWMGLILLGLSVPMGIYAWVTGHRLRRVFAVAALLGLGFFAWSADLGGVNRLIFRIPVLNRFRWPYKLLIQVNFMAVLLIGSTASVLFEGIRRVPRLRPVGAWLAALLVAAQAGQFAFVYATSPLRAVRVHPDPVPFRDDWAEGLVGGRVISVGFDYAEDPTVPTLAFDYATLWGIDQMSGYDALQLLDRHDTQQFFGLYSGYYDDRRGGAETLSVRMADFVRFGVRYWVMHPAYVAAHGAFGLTPVAEAPGRLLYEHPRAYPMVYGLEVPIGGTVRRGVNRLEAVLEAEAAGTAIVNVFPDPAFRVELDGRTVPAEALDHQLAVPVSAGTHVLTVTYVDREFAAGVWIAAAGTVLGAAAWWALRRRTTRGRSGGDASPR